MLVSRRINYVVVLSILSLCFHDTPNTTACKCLTPFFCAVDLKVVKSDAAKEIGAFFKDELESYDGIGAIRQVKILLPICVFGI